MTESEMRKMQQEAVKRAEEMQNRARAAIHHQPEQPPVHDNHVNTDTEQIHQPPEKPSEQPPEQSPQQPSEKSEQETNGFFETLMKDKERTLILSMILLLMDEKTDNSLLLALMYLLI